MKKIELFLSVCISAFFMSNTVEARDLNAEFNKNMHASDEGPGDEDCGQDFLPVLEVGKTWIYKNYLTNSPEEEIPNACIKVRVEDKRTENGRDLYTLRYSERSDINVWSDFTSTAYEEDGAVYRIDESDPDSEYIPLIDFKFGAGDSIRDFMQVSSKEKVDIEGVTRTVIKLNLPSYRAAYDWIEGVGAVSDFFILLVARPYGVRARMLECWLGDKCLFNEENRDQYVSGVSRINNDDAASSNNIIYDLMGRRITTPAPGQIYIRNGKKFVEPLSY